MSRRRRELELVIYHHIEPEDCEVRGNLIDGGPGYEAADRALEDEVIDRLNRGDTVAWCVVRVVATFMFDGNQIALAGSDTLGGCSWETEAQLWADNPELEEQAIEHALINLLKLIHGPEGHRHISQGASWLKAVSKALHRWLGSRPDLAVFTDRWLEKNS